MLPRLLSALAVILVTSPAIAQPAKPTPGDEAMARYLGRLTDQISARPLNGITSRAQWEAQRPRLRQEYLDMLGLWPLPERTPPHATVTGTLEHEGVVIEKLHFQSRPGLYVTGNLYRPKAVTGKLPTVLYVCGHSGRGRDGNKTAFQDHGMWFATNGYVCLVIDTLQLGEIPGIHHGTYREGRWWWQALGYTPAGVECWNGVRALDYLVGRPDVDAERLAVTGISGGGAATFWIAAADERVKCAVPVSGMSDLESYVKNRVIDGHCDCMFLVNTYGWEWTTIAGLVAPRPMLFANSDNDRIFPMDGNRRIIERLRKLYGWFGKPELVDEYVSKGGHDYRPDLRVAVFRWINKHLKQDSAPVKDADFRPIPGKDLRVFAEDTGLPKDAINGKVDQSFVSPARLNVSNATEFTTWREEMLQRLRSRSFRSFPDRIPLAKPTDLSRWEATIISGGECRLETVPGIEILVASVVLKGRPEPQRRDLLILNADEHVATFPSWAEPFLTVGTVVGTYPRGVKVLDWTRKSPPNYVERAHALLGSTVDEGRVRDIAATARLLYSTPGPRLPVRVLGRGPAGIAGAYAALFEPSITEVVIVDPPSSHRDGPTYLNVLRTLDLPDALGLLAPDTSLTLVNARDKAFDRSAEIYRRAGAAAKFQRK